MIRPLLALLCTLTLPATAQTVLFEDTFEEDLGLWAASGLWHWISEADPCAQPPLHPSTQGGMVYWGNSSCHFAEPTLVGNLDMVQPVSIPLTAEQAELSYASFTESEGCNGWDFHYVYLSQDGGASWDLIGDACDMQSTWTQRTIDLSGYRGSDVLIRFHFDAVDTLWNFTRGWIVDDVRITTADCIAFNYCAGAPHSASASGATMSYIGQRRVHQNNFTLAVDNAPPNQFAHFFYGPEATQSPVADGILCVGGNGAAGIMRLLPSGQIDANGHLERFLDLPSTQGTVHAILPGSLWHFQCWFRDPAGGPNGSNFSDGLAVTFCQ